jgi:hypothetical protein
MADHAKWGEPVIRSIGHTGYLRVRLGTALVLAMILGFCLGAAPPISATGQSGRGGGYRHRTESVDAEVQKLTQALTLNPRQQSAVKTILESEHQQYSHLVRNPSLNAVDRFNRLRALKESTVNQIKGVLDKDQQTKYDELRHPPQPESPTQPKGEAQDH